MMIRRIFEGANRRILPRLYSTSNKLVTVTKNENTGVSTVSLNRQPINGLNLDLLTDLKESMKTIQKDGSKGMILTSSHPTIFCAGIDILEMYKPSLERLNQFWTTLQDVWMMLFGMGLPTVAAINGASPAGGCLLAISCEYRIFVNGKHGIGLNETKLGLITPFWFQEPYTYVIGNRKAELALLRGDEFAPQQALEIGLVDELATDKADAIAKAEKYVEYYKRIPPQARAETKKRLRGSMIEKLTKNQKQDLDHFVSFVMQPQVQATLASYLESLSKKKKQ